MGWGGSLGDWQRPITIMMFYGHLSIFHAASYGRAAAGDKHSSPRDLQNKCDQLLLRFAPVSAHVRPFTIATFRTLRCLAEVASLAVASLQLLKPGGTAGVPKASLFISTQHIVFYLQQVHSHCAPQCTCFHLPLCLLPRWQCHLRVVLHDCGAIHTSSGKAQQHHKPLHMVAEGASHPQHSSTWHSTVSAEPHTTVRNSLQLSLATGKGKPLMSAGPASLKE